MNQQPYFFIEWIYVISELLIWVAYFTVPIIIFKHLPGKRDSKFNRTFSLITAFILTGGAIHFLAALIFWYPFYRLSMVLLLFTGMLSWIMVFYTGRSLPPVFLTGIKKALKAATGQSEKIMSQGLENEIRSETIYKNAPDAIIVISSKGNVVKWNPAAEKMFGWKEEEVTGKVLNELIVPEEFRAMHIAEIKHFLKTGQSEVLNRPSRQVVICKDNSTLNVEFTVSPVKIKDDYLFMGFVRDATEIRKAEEALRQSEERWRLLTSEVYDYSIIMLSPEGHIISWNEGAQRIKGYEESEIIGKHFSIFYPRDAIENNFPMEALEIVKREGRYENEGWRIKKDGSLFWANVIITSLKHNGANIGFSKITRDITERKKSEEQVTQMNALLEQRVTERTDELQQSEKKYRKLFENSPMPMWVLELPSLKFIDVNETAITNYGYTREEFLSMSTLDIRPDDEKKRFLEFDHASFLGMRKPTIWKQLKKDGSLIYAEVNAHEMNIGKQKARLVLSIDITERKKAGERLDFALEAGQIGIWELDIIHDTSVRNLLHDRIFGYNEMIPEWGIKKFLSHIPPEDVARVEDSFKQALLTQSWVIETRIIWPDRSIHWVLITGKVTGNNIEKPLKMMGTVLDITKPVQAKEEIYKLNNELEERVQVRTRELYSANKELESFSYSVSHDLRAPLRAIYGYSQILLEDYKTKLDDEGNRLLSRVMHNAKKMAQLIDDLIEFSRLGKTTLNKTCLDINKVVKEVIGELSQSNKYHQDISVGELGTAIGDEVTIRLVFQNLILNATKYSSKTEHPAVEVGVTETEKGTTYYVADNGAGFDMTYYDKMFGVFQRLHRQDEFEGTGVGLAIVQKIILKHGGQVWAQSIVNEGATFYFTLQ